MMRAGPPLRRLLVMAGAVIVALLLAGLPIWIGLPLWSGAVLGAWIYRRQGLGQAARGALGFSQSGVFGVAVEIGRAIGHGVIGVLGGLLSVLLLVSLLALLFPPPRRRPLRDEPTPDWDPLAPIGPGGASYVLQLSASPATSDAAPRLIPGLRADEPVWLWPSGWLLPAGTHPPEQDPADHYAVLGGQRPSGPGVWLLHLARARVYWLANCQVAGWRDGKPWFEPRGGGRLLAVDDCLVASEPLPPVTWAGLLDVAQLLPPLVGQPVVVDAAAGMPPIALHCEWPVGGLQAADPLAPIRQARFRLWIEDRDTSLVVADDPAALRWQASTSSLWIHALDADGQVQPWLWRPGIGLQRASQNDLSELP